jgi:hypothetical protein
MYKAKNSYTNAVLAAELTAFGWTWHEDQLDRLFKGKMHMGSEQKAYVRLFLLDKYQAYNSS